ncbi:2-dehydro-3-deoxygalactonokinase [Erwiniaceae bacterium BAC15a-03b]|uniref:2-dehydro-3-deoxygalactonokinase n=1 Tax=Winslowiella arboricola TaxID=2978220 RepID=A0A9J6PGZ1_9GAMM|nr:2-dehydro-3-deoxygalactonokinase [Winslowiella arboricola]MCU5771776.1 2-dehydro-3-deoxygalactonokinase [Winslowiella arboricola]MCU5776626.1 2-dehydro-3-deoxygalactonokinase [Winslowiella arboricola]
MNYIAVDWGTSNFRAIRVTDGQIAAIVQSDQGVGRCQREMLPLILQQQIARLGEHYHQQLPVIVCGMAGSNIGLCDAGYQSLPLAFSALQDKGIPLPGILPNPLTIKAGISSPAEWEVCRGEEMQLLGALYLSDARIFAAVGTHSKWLTVDRDHQQITGLCTLMSGELYNLLLNHSVVGKGLPPQTFSREHFLAGVDSAALAKAQQRDLMTELFRCRGRYILGQFDAAYAACWLSGFLTAHELLTGHPRQQPVCFIGASSLLEHYQLASHHLELPCTTLAAEEALIAGLNKVFEHDV